MAFQKEGQFVKVTKPQKIESKKGDVFKKSDVVINYTESNKKGTFVKELALQLFGKPEYVDKVARGIKDKYSSGDKVKTTFIVESREGGKGGYFTTAKFFYMDHADSNSDDSWDDSGSDDDWDEGSDDAFDKPKDTKEASNEEDDQLPF